MPFRALARSCGLSMIFATGMLHAEDPTPVPASPPLAVAPGSAPSSPSLPSAPTPAPVATAPTVSIPTPPPSDPVAMKSADTAVTVPEAPAAGPPAPQDMQPPEFLACVGQQTKARWRQLYREQAPTPSSQRLRAAFTLGSLQGDAYLALQAGDSQRFRDNNQDVLNHCRVLGLAEKMSPDLMAEAKMAQTEDWAALRAKIGGTHKLTETLLQEQRDEDLAILVNLGMWMRLFEVASTLVVNDTEVQNKSLCVGSVHLLNELMARYERLTESTRQDPSVVLLGNVLQMLQKHWSNTDEAPPQETIEMTFEKLRFIMEKMK
ncbi:hypothetical protein [Roseimicrobium gellanilyticum]|nr:hypothetical protein [Roseimicrobium gellanilyticum]